MKKNNLLKVIGLLFLMMIYWNFFCVNASAAESDFNLVEGIVIQEEKVGPKEQIVTVKVLAREFIGQTYQLNNSLLINPWPNLSLNTGDKIILTIETQGQEIKNVYISEYGRANKLYMLVGLYILLLVGIGGKKGLKSVIALGLTCFTIMFLLLPLLLAGYKTLWITTIVLAGITLFTMPIIGGINKKTGAATLGTISGVAMAGIVAYFSGEILHLTGFIDENAQELILSLGFPLDLKGLLFSGIIIGALGATMDVGMSIASSIEEVKKANPRLSPTNLFIAGINVGRDIMGTMANTLILAYVGSSLPIMLYFMANQTSTINIINSEFIATELVRGIAGSIGLTITVPITSFLAAIFYGFGKRQ